eukprot:6187619-Pleurochrysis_carterae.AAC.3
MLSWPPPEESVQGESGRAVPMTLTCTKSIDQPSPSLPFYDCAWWTCSAIGQLPAYLSPRRTFSEALASWHCSFAARAFALIDAQPQLASCALPLACRVDDQDATRAS